MLRFGIIAEGVTDRYVLENILLGYCASDHEPEFDPIQPPPGGEGGWERVFLSLERGDHEGALQFNCDFVVIQIDTDVSQEPKYGVPWREEGRDLTVEELVARITARLKRFISPAFWQANQEKILFAVAVHEIECWLLPLLHDDNKAAKTSGCTEAASHALRKAGQPSLVGKDGKQKDAYDKASLGYRKRKTLLALRDKNPSLKLFLDQLDALVGPRLAQAPSAS
jgi:hypothetical protein